MKASAKASPAHPPIFQLGPTKNDYIMDDVRREELETLQAIYGDETTLDFESLSGRANLQISVDDGLPVTLQIPGSNVFRSTKVNYLPCILLHFTLPEKYPYEEPPELDLVCLIVPDSKLNEIKASLLQQWQDTKDQVLFSMVEYLKENVGWKVRDLIGSKFSCADDGALYEQLIEYDSDVKQRVFDLSTFTCEICQSDLKGEHCLKFSPCDHIFCNDCLRNFFTSLIESGSVEKVHCPDFECSKRVLGLRERYLRLDTITGDNFNFEDFKKQIMTPHIKTALLQRILGDGKGLQLYNKFLQLFADHQHALIAKMFPMRLVSCPRENCPAMIFRENITNRLVICRQCQYAFCNTCRKSYHSDSIDCAKKNKDKQYYGVPEEALQRWLDSEPDSKERSELKYKYGSELMKKVSDEYKMDKLFNDLLKNESQDFSQCPTCDLIIQRLDGCNKMKCSSCYTFFCNVCSTFLDYDHPYDHFTDHSSPCYGKLFHGMPGVADIPPEE